MKKLIPLLFLLLVGCSTPTQQFTNIQTQIPKPDPWIMEEPQQLKALPGDKGTKVKDSDALSTVTENYSMCNEWRDKLKAAQTYIRTITQKDAQ